MATIQTYRIVRRAFSQYETVDVVETTWMAAMNICMMMEARNGDGEYLLRGLDEPDSQPAAAICPVQAAFAYL